MLEVLQTGPLCTVQDLGREGWQHLGVGPGGALDAGALRRANLLVGNAPGAAALEVLAGPVRLRFQRPGWLALCGAGFEMQLDGRVVRGEWRWPFDAGAELRIHGPVQGRVGVLAVDGGLAVPEVMGSRATHCLAGFGGWQGRALRAGDVLPLGPPRFLQGIRGLRLPQVTPPESPDVLRVLQGPEWPLLDAESQRRFTDQLWRQGVQSDRMGARLEGQALRLREPCELRSHAVAPGWIQLPPSGLPIVLLADAQSTGGYPRLAAVIEADASALAQWRPGEACRFQWVDESQARAASELQARQWAQWEWACP